MVPPAGRQAVLELLHESHPGVSRMKNLARSYVWWPNIDKDIDMIVKTCYDCQQTRHSPPVAPLHPWEWPQRPWARIHIDYAGPVEGKMLLVIVDAHSKWLDVAVVTSATSSVTIEKLRGMFTTHGIPEIVVSDNGTVFTSDEFETFMISNGIRHIKSAPYHPSTNGLADRAIQTLKGNLKKSKTGPLETRISRFLFKYRTTPHTTTGISPAELLMGRQLRSHCRFFTLILQYRPESLTSSRNRKTIMIPMPASDTLPLATLFSFVIFQLVRIGFQALSHKPRVHYHF